jgi:hypothetical protein
LFGQQPHGVSAELQTGTTGELSVTQKAFIKNRLLVTLVSPNRVARVGETGVKYKYEKQTTPEIQVKEGKGSYTKAEDFQTTFAEVVSSPKGTDDTGLVSVKNAHDAFTPPDIIYYPLSLLGS